MTTQNKQTLKRHLISAIVTFFTAFAITLLADIDRITIDTMRNGASLGILFSAIRAGVKVLLERFIVRQTRQNS